MIWAHSAVRLLYKLGWRNALGTRSQLLTSRPRFTLLSASVRDEGAKEDEATTLSPQ